MKFKKFFSIFVSALIIFEAYSFYSFHADEFEDAEFLYTKMTEFLKEYNSVSPEKIDDVCKEFMKSRIPESNLLNEQDFNEKSKGNIILYRGVDNKKYADEFKHENIFLSCWNARGSGIYTTTSLDCAKYYHQGASEHPDDTLIKMFISQKDVKILDDKYLEKLQEIIVEKHPEEFGEFKNNKYIDKYVFDSLSEYINSFNEVCQTLDKMNLSKEDYVKEKEKRFEEIRKKYQVTTGSIYEKLLAERKTYYKSNKAYVWFNSGLLTKLMGFDVLYTVGLLRTDLFDEPEEEYLVVNPNVLNVLEG